MEALIKNDTSFFCDIFSLGLRGFTFFFGPNASNVLVLDEAFNRIGGDQMVAGSNELSLEKKLRKESPECPVRPF